MTSSSPTARGGNETTPLLATGQTLAIESLLQSEQTNIENAHNEAEDKDKPLPRAQIFLLCYARAVEPIAFFAIFPFINKMIFEAGNVKEEDVGFYSGLIVCLNS